MSILKFIKIGLELSKVRLVKMSVDTQTDRHQTKAKILNFFIPKVITMIPPPSEDSKATKKSI